MIQSKHNRVQRRSISTQTAFDNYSMNPRDYSIFTIIYSCLFQGTKILARREHDYHFLKYKIYLKKFK